MQVDPDLVLLGFSIYFGTHMARFVCSTQAQRKQPIYMTKPPDTHACTFFDIDGSLFFCPGVCFAWHGRVYLYYLPAIRHVPGRCAHSMLRAGERCTSSSYLRAAHCNLRHPRLNCHARVCTCVRPQREVEHVFTEGASAVSERYCFHMAHFVAESCVYVDVRMLPTVRHSAQVSAPDAWSGPSHSPPGVRAASFF